MLCCRWNAGRGLDTLGIFKAEPSSQCLGEEKVEMAAVRHCTATVAVYISDTLFPFE